MINLKNVTKFYGKHAVLKDINIEIAENKIVFFMGQNGSGKTTLLKCMLDLERYQGDILFDGEPFHKIRDQVQVVYDDSPLYLNLNGYKNIELLLYKNIKVKEMKNAAYQLLGHEMLKSKVKNYSYGQRKKLSVIIAILSEPKYLFLDEVSNGLDYDTMEFLKGKLKEWSKEMSIITTGHQFEFYTSIVDEVFIVHHSSIVHLNQFKKGDQSLNDIYHEYVK